MDNHSSSATCQKQEGSKGLFFCMESGLNCLLVINKTYLYLNKATRKVAAYTQLQKMVKVNGACLGRRLYFVKMDNLSTKNKDKLIRQFQQLQKTFTLSVVLTSITYCYLYLYLEHRRTASTAFILTYTTYYWGGVLVTWTQWGPYS